MHWSDTVASKCRYGNVAGRIFGSCDIIWECSENYFGGFANVLAATPDGTFIHYEWTFGSCSVCDTWERQYGWDDDADDKIEAEMRRDMVTFPDMGTLLRYLGNASGTLAQMRMGLNAWLDEKVRDEQTY